MDADPEKVLEARIARALKFLERFKRSGAYQDLYAAMDVLRGDL